MILDFIRTLTEDAPTAPTNTRVGGIEHAEDAIFTNSAEAARVLQTFKKILTNTNNVTVKWDGAIALHFGRDATGAFFCSDKYMYDKGILAKSPNDWIEYDKTKKSGTLRPDLYKKIQAIWTALEASIQKMQVQFKGDLMFAGKLKPVDGNFVFDGPTVRYSVNSRSQLGQLITGRVGLIVVHGMNDKQWDGKTGIIQGTPIAIIAPNFGTQFQNGTYNKTLSTLETQAEKAVKTLGPQADNFWTSLGTKAAKDNIVKFFRHKVTNQTQLDIGEWLQTTAPGTYNKLVPTKLWDEAGFNAVTTIYNNIYKLKIAFEQVFDQQVQGVTMGIKNKAGDVVAPGGEGFVYSDPDTGEMVKMVNDNFRKWHFQK